MTRAAKSNTSAPNDAGRPKGRIRRSMTACHTCRKLKTRCDLDPRSHACRRCLSLRIECELPETPERFQDSSYFWPDATTAIPCLDERLISLERSMGEMARMMRQMMDQSSSNVSCASSSHFSRSPHHDGPLSAEGASLLSIWPLSLPKPVRLIRELQSEFFGTTDNSYSLDTVTHHGMGDVFAKGVIDSKLSEKLIRLFVDHFGSWVSIDDPSDVQNDPLLFSTACLLASRYMPDIPPAVVNAMYLQVKNASASILWSPPPLKYSTLQALTLLCLWSSTAQKEVPMDSWLLSGISINHAIISFDFLNRPPVEHVVNDDMFKKLRLWNSLCLSQLHFAIGNARPFNLQERYLDHCSRILAHPNATFEDGKVVAEIQLYATTLKLQSDTQRMRFAECEYEEIERWKMEWAHLLTGEQSTNLEISLWFCQLLLHRTAMRLQCESEKFIPEIIQNSRLVVSKFLQIRPYSALNLLDHVFSMVSYAALTLCDFYVVDPLIDQVQVYLLHISPSEEHIACRFACIIGELKRRYTEATDLSRVIKGSPFGGGRGGGGGGGDSTSSSSFMGSGGGSGSASCGDSSPFVTTVDSRGVSLEPGSVPFMPPLLDSIVDADYGVLDQITTSISDFVPSQVVTHHPPVTHHAHGSVNSHVGVNGHGHGHGHLLSGGLFHDVSVGNGIPVSMV